MIAPTDRRIVVACILGLVGLALVCWSVLDLAPIPIFLAMSVAQGLGTLSLALFVWVILGDLRRAGVLGRAVPPEQK